MQQQQPEAPPGEPCPHCGTEMKPFRTPVQERAWICQVCRQVHVIHRKEAFAKGF